MKKDDDKLVETSEEAAAEGEQAPRKIMLGKRVLRTFTVRSGVQAGMDGVADLGCPRCCVSVA